jgi:hypothetical protein
MILTTILGAGLWVQPSWAHVDDPGDRLWVSTHDDGLNDNGNAVVVSPDGSKAFVAGRSDDETSRDYLTIAYEAATGQELWVARYDGAAGLDLTKSAAVSPDGMKVFVTGSSWGGIDAYDDYATIAYDAATGAELWIQRYDGPASDYDTANSLAVVAGGVAGGGAVYVTGVSQGDYATVAYDAATGAQMWVRRYDGPGGDIDWANSVAAAPNGSSVLVTGHSFGSGDSDFDYATIAYDAATGTEQWIARYDGGSLAFGQDVAVSPDSSTAFVTGYGSTGKPNSDFVTIAYDVTTGTAVWTQPFDGRENMNDEAYALSVSPNGKVVVVTGKTPDDNGYYDYATVAYDAATGAQRWVRLLGRDLKEDVARAVVVSPDNRAVYVTGEADGGFESSDDYGTVAYRLGTGRRLWLDRLDGERGSSDFANDIAVSPDGTAVLVTGSGNGGEYDVMTVAYATSR